ncbi:MAG: TolC family protein [Polyangiales bacterium]
MRPLSFVAVFVLASMPVGVRAESLRLDEAVRQALAANERALKAPLRVDQAEGSLHRARDAFFPTLVLGSQYAWTPNGKTTSTVNGGLTLTQPILNPSAFPLYSQAKHNFQAEKWGAAQDLRQLAFDTAKAFMGTLATERVLAAANRRLDTAKANHDYAEARVAAGLTSSNDVTRADVEIASAQATVVNAQSNVDRAYITLSFLLAKPVPPGLAVPEVLTRSAMLYEPKEAEIQAAIDHRFDVKAAHEKTEAAQDFAKEPFYRLIPSVNAQAALRFDPDPVGSAKKFDESITFNLTWSVFDAGFRYADRETRVAQAKSTSLDEKLLRRSVEADIKLALVSLRAARKTLEISETGVTAAKKSLDETTILYKQGLAKQIEFTNATLSVFDAELTRESARLTMEQAYLDLRQALGMDPTE